MSFDVVAATQRDTNLPERYGGMLDRISKAMPAINRDSANFYKSHSQYMYATLDVTQLTTIRSIKHTLAEIDRTRAALAEVHIKQRRDEVDLRQKRQELESATGFDRERIEIDILEIEMRLAAMTNTVQGAVRKLSFMVAQYESLMARFGKDELTEADYEADEARFHILTCLKQALCAARSRGGIIDEGNHIYLFEMGLPSAEVQAAIIQHLTKEEQMISEGLVPLHENTMRFLEACADRWQDCAEAFAARRGVPMRDVISLHSS